MRQIILPLLALATLLTSCNGQTATQNGLSNEPAEALQTGDTVAQLGNNIMVVYQDRNNQYWFGSWETGVYRYDGETILHYTTKHGLPGNRVEEIREDGLGNVLINTNAGLCKFDGKQIDPIHETIPHDPTWKLEKGDLWFKSPKRGQVYRYDGKSLHNLKIPTSKVGDEYVAKNPSAIDPYGIYCIYNDSRGNVWFGTAVLGALRYNGRSFDWITEPDVTEMHDGPSNGVRSIIEDHYGDFWFNCEYRYRVLDTPIANGKRIYERTPSIGSLDGNQNGDLKEYLSIAMDNKGHLWFATYRNGVWEYDGTNVMHHSVEENGKAINIFYIYKDRLGNLWIGTHTNGAWKFNGEQFVRFQA